MVAFAAENHEGGALPHEGRENPIESSPLSGVNQRDGDEAGSVRVTNLRLRK